MGVFDNDMILPGAITDIESDYSQGYDTSKWGTTDSVTIIGTAFNGPVGKEVKIYSPEHAQYIFGSTYNSTTKKEATLVAEIQDAWDRGCRTIWAVRVSGQDIYKDFEFAINSTLKLRVSGIFPSNANKDVYMLYDDTTGAESITIYKPANRATIAEKMEGLVENDNSILSLNLDLANSYGYTKGSALVDLISLVNENASNNVLRLSIVDLEGNDVTLSSKDAKSLQVGVLFPGLYMLGREASLCTAVTDANYVFVSSDKSNNLFDGFDGKFYKKLSINTDVVSNLPVYGPTVTALNNKFKTASVSMTSLWDILTVAGQLDKLFKKDSTDYEEVDLTDFELYQKLGSGFAVTAKAEFKGNTTDVKIKETPVSDSNRIASINDGIYSMLENLDSNYRVLVNGTADQQITGKIPKKDSFKVATANSFDLMGGLVTATAVIDPADLTEAKKYGFTVEELKDGEIPAANPVTGQLDSLYIDQTIQRISKVATLDEINYKKYKNGSLFLVGNATCGLYRYTNGSLVLLNDSVVHPDLVGKLYAIKDTDNKDYVFIGKVDITTKLVSFQKALAILPAGKDSVLVECAGTISVYSYDGAAAEIKAIGNIDDILSSDEDKTLITIQNEYASNNVITIKSSVLDYTTIEEFVDILNTNDYLSQFFTFSITSDNILNKDEYVKDFAALEFDPTASYLDGAKCMYLGVMYVAKGNMAALPVMAAATNPSDLGWHVAGSYTLYSDNAVTYMKDSLMVDPTTLLPYIVTTDFVSEVSKTIADYMANLALNMYAIDKSIGYNTALYIPYKTVDNFARQLAQHCTYTSLKTAPTHGVIGCTKLMDVTLNAVASKVSSVAALDLNLYAKKSNGKDMLDKNNLPYDIGRNISVVLGQYYFTTADNYTYISAAPSGYAGMVSCLPLDQSSTSQAINIPDPMYNLTNYQLEALTQKGFITFKSSYTKGYVVTDGVTQAPSTSPFRRLSVTRIINSMEESIRAAVEPFIGKQNHLANRNSMQTAIKSALENMKGTLIEAYDFTLTVDQASMKLGIINIAYRIVPIYEIREVRNSISIRDSLS